MAFYCSNNMCEMLKDGHARCCCFGIMSLHMCSLAKACIGLDEKVDIPQLPVAVPRGEFKPVKLSDGSPTVIAIDLETTDLIRGGRQPHITQLAAVDIESGNRFNIYVSPKVPMTYEAQQITGISYNGNVMTVNGRAVESFDIHTACNKFCIWLEQFSNVILMAHNGRRFDFPLLISAFLNTNKFRRFDNCVVGCFDSLALFKKVYPGRSSYRQEGLVLDILKSRYNAHDAMGDVISLSSLFKKSSVAPADYMKLTFTPKAVHLNQMFLHEKAKNMPSITTLVTRGVCKSTTAENIAGSGLNLNNLRTIFNHQGEDGLHTVFTRRNSEGQPRVTGDKRTLESVIPKLAKYFKK